MKNINSFLTACQATFGLKSSDLFTAEHLYYASDFAKCVHTISLLSKSQQAGLAGFKYFPQDHESTENRADEDGQDMYQSLEDLVGQSLSLEEAAQNAPVFIPDATEEVEEDLYGALQETVEAGSEEVYTGLLSLFPLM